MPVRVGALVSYVAVERGAREPEFEFVTAAALAMPAAETLPAIPLPETPGAAARGPAFGDGSRPAAEQRVVLERLTDRVYRIMRDEITVALERE